MPLKQLLTIIAIVLIFGSLSYGALLPGEHRIDAAFEIGARLPSNSIIDIKPDGDSLWLGTGRGLAELHLDNSEWSVINQDNGLGQGGISALTITDSIMWAATAYTEHTSVGALPAGGGVGYSRDFGNSWTWFDQPLDDRDEEDYKPTTTNVQNVTYDIAISPLAVWITSWGGGLRRKFHDSNDWEVITPDGQPFTALGNLNHVAFSAVHANGVLWVGTAAGINRSENEGETWTKFSHLNNDPNTISGNFITGLAVQNTDDATLIWGATWKAQGSSEYYGISVTDDNGASWRVPLSDSTILATGDYLVDVYGPLRVHNFGFLGDTVYAAADGGLWWHPFRGKTDVESWHVINADEIVDETIDERFDGADFFSVAPTGDSLWVGTDDGLALRMPDPMSPREFVWRIHRAHRPAGVDGEPETFAYPSPFSPQREGFTRFQFSLNSSELASYEMYNWAMESVYKSGNSTITGGGTGNMAGYATLRWDGRDNSGRIVANGVYFYKLKVGDKTHWGKVMILD